MSLFALLLFLFIAGVLLNAFFAGYETGFIASNALRVRTMAEKENSPAAQRLLAYIDKPDHMITVVLVGTNLALVMGTLALTRQVGPLWATIIATPMFLIFGEVVPKSIFRAHPTRLALLFLPVIRAFDVLLAPLTYPIMWLSRGFIAIVNREQQEIRSLLNTSDDVRVLVNETADHGAIDDDEKEMIHSVMDLHTRHAKEVMVPRIRIKAVSETFSRRDLVAVFRETGFTRIPVYRDNIDQIIGVASAFSVLTDTGKNDSDIARFIQPVMHVPDTMRLDDLLEQMRATRKRIAIVTDEFGGTDGLITVEDILEEIFGEIHDEHDKAEEPIRKVGLNAWSIDARLALVDAEYELELGIEDDEVETVAGWVMRLAGRIPDKGEVFTAGRYKIEVLDGGPNYIARIRLELLDKTPADTPRNGKAG